MVDFIHESILKHRDQEWTNISSRGNTFHPAAFPRQWILSVQTFVWVVKLKFPVDSQELGSIQADEGSGQRGYDLTALRFMASQRVMNDKMNIQFLSVSCDPSYRNKALTAGTSFSLSPVTVLLICWVIRLKMDTTSVLLWASYRKPLQQGWNSLNDSALLISLSSFLYCTVSMSNTSVYAYSIMILNCKVVTICLLD